MDFQVYLLSIVHNKDNHFLKQYEYDINLIVIYFKVNILYFFLKNIKIKKLKKYNSKQSNFYLISKNKLKIFFNVKDYEFRLLYC